MLLTNKIRFYINLALLSLLGFFSFSGQAQNDFDEPNDFSAPPAVDSGSTYEPKKSNPAGGAEDENVIHFPKDRTVTVVKTFSDSERRKICGKYNGSFISIFGEIFKIENCQRRLIADSEIIFQLQRSGVKITEVDPRNLAAIGSGKPIESTVKNSGKRTCKDVASQYVTYSSTEIYYIENCSKRLLPDYETFSDHARKKGKKMELTILTPEELARIKDGSPFSSTIDRKENVESPYKSSVDIISINEACKGLEGKMITFHSKIYRVEKCRKREYDPEIISKTLLKSTLKPVEVTDSVWISMPNGKPLF